MNIKRLIISLLLIILLASTTAFGADVPLGPYFSDTYFDLSGSALILKIVPHEKGGLEADVSAYDGLILITGGATSNLTIGIGDDNIVEMDDADAAIDDYCKLTANGIVGRSYSEVKTDLSLNYVENLKVKLDGTAAPTVNNDTTEGYTVGSRWVDVTNDKAYVCLDNTDGAAVWTETTQAGGGGAFTDLTDTPANYTGSSLKHVRVNVGETALEFVTLGGGGDMLKATYDTDEDSDIDVAAGGTEKSSWTQYCIPYLSGTTAFGEIPIGADNYALTVNGATGYDWTEFQTPLTFGIADTNKVQINSATVANNDYAKFTATGLEGRSYSETMEDLNPITTKTGIATLTVAEAGTVLVSAGSAYTLTLPTAVGHAGLQYHFIKTDCNYNLITLDGDGTETFNYENSTGAPVTTYGRLNTLCAGVTIVSDNSNWQVIDEALGLVPTAWMYVSGTQENIPSASNVRLELATAEEDVGSNFRNGTWITSTASATEVNHLHDTNNSPFTTNMVGCLIKNTTDSTETYISSYISTSDVILKADIFASGETYLLKRADYLIPIAGRYMICTGATSDNSTTADKRYGNYIYKNDVNQIATRYHASIASYLGPIPLRVDVNCSKDDVIKTSFYNGSDVDTVDIHEAKDSSFLRIRLISKE